MTSDSADQVMEEINGESDHGDVKLVEDQDYRLGGRAPLKTILLLMIGPIMSQITGAMYGFCNSLWGSNALGEIVMVAIGIEQVFENIGRAFGYFLMMACSTQISKLFGEKKNEETGQVACDMLRMCVICGIIVPCIVLPLHGTIARWFGAAEETVDVGFQYILPISAGTTLSAFNLCCQGILQAEGRTLLIGFIDLSSIIVSMGALVPFFLYVCHMGIRSCAIAYLMADTIPGITLIICFFCGVFNTKPKLSQLLKPFSKHSSQALIVGGSQLIANLAFVIPGIPIRKVMGDCCKDVEEFDHVMAGFNVLIRISTIASSIVLAVTVGYTPCASYANSSKNYKRYLRLTFHGTWISASWSILTTILIYAIPKQICQIFSTDPVFVDYSSRMLFISNSFGWIIFYRFMVTSILQTLQLGGRAMLMSFLSNFLLLIIFTYILYYTNKHDPVRIMWNYSITYGVGVVVGFPLVAGPFYKIIKLSREQDGETNPLERNLNDGDVDETIAKDQLEEPINTIGDEEALVA